MPARERSARHCGCYVQMRITGMFIKGPIFHPRTSFSREVAGPGNHNRDSDRMATVTKPAANILFSTSYVSHTPHKLITFDCFDSSIGKMQTSPVYRFCNGGLRASKVKLESSESFVDMWESGLRSRKWVWPQLLTTLDPLFSVLLLGSHSSSILKWDTSLRSY